MTEQEKTPSDWRKSRLGRLLTIKHGYAFKSECFAASGPFVLLTPGNFYEDGGFRSKGDQEKYYTGDVPSEYILKRGDLLIAMTEQAPGLLGSSILVPEDNLYLHNQRLGLVNDLDESEIDRLFLYYLFNYRGVRAQIHTTASGTKVRHTAPSRIYEVEVLLPLLPEQRKIAEILSTWDRAIALTERCIEAARQRKKGLMQRLLTGRVRFPEFGRDEWQEVQLGKVFTERKEQGHEDLPLLSVTADEGIIHRDELDRRDTSSADKSKYLRVHKGDIVYNTMRMWQGRSGVSSLEGIVSPAYTVCKPKPSVDSDFVGYLFQLPSVVYLFRRYSQGLVSDTWNLKFKHFAGIRVRIPKIEEQRCIAAVLQACDREIELLIQKRDALQRQKKGLMQQLLRGRVRVKV